MGTRLYRTPSNEALAALNGFTARMAAALARPLPLRPDTLNDLTPRPVQLSPEARQVWIEFSDHIERMIGPGGQLEPVSGFAAKMAEHEARIAAVMAWWRDHDVREIDCATITGAIQLVEHSGDEALRLYRRASSLKISQTPSSCSTG